MDTDDAFASTRTLVTLRVRLLLSLSRCWTVLTCDISTAFLHAPMLEPLFMRPPVEFYPEGNCLWLLKRAMYGLKQAPAFLQTHFAETMISLDFTDVRLTQTCTVTPLRNCMYCVMWMAFLYVETVNASSFH